MGVLTLLTAFGTLKVVDKWNASAITEWVIALIFTAYVLSFAIDFLPVNIARFNRRQAEADVEKNSLENGSSVGGQGHNFLPNSGHSRNF